MIIVTAEIASRQMDVKISTKKNHFFDFVFMERFSKLLSVEDFSIFVGRAQWGEEREFSIRNGLQFPLLMK